MRELNILEDQGRTEFAVAAAFRRASHLRRIPCLHSVCSMLSPGVWNKKYETLSAVVQITLGVLGICPWKLGLGSRTTIHKSKK